MAFERFQLVERIGEGASAVVYEALDTTTGATVALKILSPHLASEPVSVERFRREVRITRLLGHPNIVPVFDLLQEDGQTALVMERIEGDSLAQVLASHGPLPVDDTVDVLRQLLGVLAACHDANVVHRDLKPQNILRDRGGNIRVLDFGIAKMSTLADITQTGTSIGSPEYMAPELFSGNRFDPRIDLYAAGIIGYELLAGVPPFRGESLAILYQRHAHEPLPPLDFREDVPPWLRHLLERLTAKQPHVRYQSAGEALLDIERRRVLARELPPVRRRVCLACGAETAADLLLCSSCGQEASLQLRAGDVDVRCDEDVDDVRLAEFLQTVVGVSPPARPRHRTLLFTALDGTAAQHLVQRAGEHGLALRAAPHSPGVEMRKAVALALVCFTASWYGAALGSAHAYYGAAVGAWWREQGILTWLLWSVLGVVLWLSARRFRSTEVEPLVTLGGAAGPVPREVAWLRRMAPLLTPQRSDETKAFVAALVEKCDRIGRFARGFDAATARQLEELTERAAQLATVIGEIESALQSPIFAERIQRYAFVEGQLRIEQDAGERSTLARRAAVLREEVDAVGRLEEKCSALTASLVSVHALFNRLVGRLLVHHAPMDEESRGTLSELVKGLNDDLRVSREVRTELERCR